MTHMERLLLWVLTFVAIVTLAAGPLLVTQRLDQIHTNSVLLGRIDDTVAANQRLTCSLGDLVTLSNAPRRTAIKGPLFHVRAELDFLTAIRAANCPVVAHHDPVRVEIDKTIDLIQRFLARHAENP